MKPSPPGWIEKLPRVVAGAILAGTAVVFCAGVFGGFDFTDEGAYYLGFAHPNDVPDGNTSYRFFGAQIFTLLGHSIVGMRFFTLVAMMTATVIFLRGWKSFTETFSPDLTRDRDHNGLVQTAALIASFLSFIISPVSLSYNFQNAFCLLAATGFLLKAVTIPPSARPLDFATLFPLVSFGVLTAFQFFVKFSSSIILIAAGSFFFFAVSKRSLGHKMAQGAVLLVFVGLVAFVYFIFLQSFERWWTGINGIARLVTRGSYTSGQLQRYFSEFSPTALRAFVPAWTVAIPAIIGMFAFQKLPRWRRLVAPLGGLSVIAAFFFVANDLDYYLAMPSIGLTIYLSCLILLSILAIAGRLFRGGQGGEGDPWRMGCGGGLLFLIPYFGSFGTSNDINQNCLYQLAPWFALIGWLLADIDHRWGIRWLGRAGMLLLASVAGIQFYQGYWKNAYRVAGTRSEQRVPTLIGEPAAKLALSPETHDFIMTARRSLQENGFKTGDDLLVFFDLPGFVFAMGGSSPGHYWYFAGDQSALDDSSLHVRLLDPERRKRAFIVRNSNDDWAAFLPYLRAAGLPFPEGYRLITPPMTSPLTQVKFEIWRPVAR